MNEIYLAGPIRDVDDNGKNWRERVKEEYDFYDFNDPLDKYNAEVDDVRIVEEVPDEKEEGIEYVTPEEIVHADKRLIDASEVVFVGWTDVTTVGTPMEVQYVFMMNFLWNAYMKVENVPGPLEDAVKVWHSPKPVIVWDRREDPEKSLSPWLTYHADFHSRDLEKCFDYLEGREL